MKQYFWNILVWLDQGLNTIAGGDPDETVSSRAGKAQLLGKTWGCLLCKILDWFESNHCIKNIEQDEGKNASIKG